MSPLHARNNQTTRLHWPIKNMVDCRMTLSGGHNILLAGGTFERSARTRIGQSRTWGTAVRDYRVGHNNILLAGGTLDNRPVLANQGRGGLPYVNIPRASIIFCWREEHLGFLPALTN